MRTIGEENAQRVRTFREIEIEGKKAWALFDTGSMHTYVSNRLLEDVPVRPLSKPYRVALGGRSFEIKTHCSVQGKIEGHEFHTEVVPIDEVGRVNGNVLDVIIGALTMEEWEIIPNLKEGTLDLSGLRRREFIEFVCSSHFSGAFDNPTKVGTYVHSPTRFNYGLALAGGMNVR